MKSTIFDFKTIIDHYGVEAQLGMLQEECAEVIQAVSKIRRHGKNKADMKHLTEEVADVLVVINEFIATGELNYDEIHKIMDRKVERELKRIKEAECTE